MRNLTKKQWFQRVQDAGRRLGGQANKTPVMSSRTLNEIVGAEVFLKCENYQRVGAFKFRGAFNAMSRLSEDQRKRGIITHSSGNHAQAVAFPAFFPTQKFHSTHGVQRFTVKNGCET